MLYAATNGCTIGDTHVSEWTESVVNVWAYGNTYHKASETVVGV